MDLLSNTKELCFLCHTKFNSEYAKETYNNLSIQYLMHHLKIDTSFIGFVRRSKLNVMLCNDCVYLTNKFSTVYTKLEKARLEMEDCLKLINKKLSDTSVIKLLMDNKSEHNKGKGMILWNQMKLKCFAKLKTTSPQLKLRQLTAQETKRFTRLPRPIKEQLETRASELEISSVIKVEPKKELLDYAQQAIKSEPNTDCHQASKIDVAIVKVETLSEHLSPPNVSQSSTESRATCKVCKKTFTRHSNMRNHYLTVHLKQIPQVKKITCEICNAEFKHNRNLWRHRQDIHGGKTMTCVAGCKRRLSPDEFHEHQRKCKIFQKYIKTSTTTPIKCKLCLKTFKNLAGFHIHLTTFHSKQLIFECSICLKKFRTEVRLQVHSVEEHKSSSKYICRCGKELLSKHTYRMHKRKCAQ